MIFQKLNRDDAEKIFIIVQNDEASNAFLKGAPVNLKMDGTLDGVAAERSNTGAAAKNHLTAGLADDTTAAGAYGLVQVYGLRTDAVINQGGTASNANGAIGDVLGLFTASNALSGLAAGTLTMYYAAFALAQTVASSTAIATTTGKVFIRCM